MLSGVWAAVRAFWAVATFGTVANPPALLAPSAYSQKVMGAACRSACLWINSLG